VRRFARSLETWIPRSYATGPKSFISNLRASSPLTLFKRARSGPARSRSSTYTKMMSRTSPSTLRT